MLSAESERKSKMKRSITIVIIAMMLCIITNCASIKPSECMQAYHAKQFQKAIPLCQQLSDSKNGEGYYVLGLIYDIPVLGATDPEFILKERTIREEQGIKLNKELSKQYFKKASDAGHLMATEILIMLAAQEGDYALVAFYRNREAEWGSWGAMQGLAFQYAEGKGVSKDLVQAYKWYYLGYYSNGGVNTCKSREELASRMTLPQVKEAIQQAKETAKSRGKSGKDKCAGLKWAFDCEANNEPERCMQMAPNVTNCTIPPRVKSCKYRPYKLIPAV